MKKHQATEVNSAVTHMYSCPAINKNATD